MENTTQDDKNYNGDYDDDDDDGEFNKCMIISIQAITWPWCIVR